MKSKIFSISNNHSIVFNKKYLILKYPHRIYAGKPEI